MNSALVSSRAKLVPCAAPRCDTKPMLPPRLSGMRASNVGNGSAQTKVLKGPYIVKITSDKIEYEQGISAARSDSQMLDYLTTSIQTFPDIELPMGGSLVRRDAQNFVLTAPKLELFDMWLQPKASALVRPNGNLVEVISGDCLLEGSTHVQDMNLNDRFIVDVSITFGQKAGSSEPKIISKGCISVDIDVPSPFNLMPAPAIEAVGNTALALCVRLILSTITGVLVTDYNKWATAQR